MPGACLCPLKAVLSFWQGEHYILLLLLWSGLPGLQSKQVINRLSSVFPVQAAALSFPFTKPLQREEGQSPWKNQLAGSRFTCPISDLMSKNSGMPLRVLASPPISPQAESCCQESRGFLSQFPAQALLSCKTTSNLFGHGKIFFLMCDIAF